MEIERMPGCCGAVVLLDFGGGEDGDVDWKSINDFRYSAVTLKEAIPLVKDQLKYFKKYGTAKIVFATTTSNQPLAEKLLEECGFYTSKTAGPTSGNRTIRGWFLPIHEWEG